MREAKYPRILFIISIIFLVAAAAVFMYSRLNAKNIEQLKSEGAVLSEKLNKAEAENAKLKGEFEEKNNALYEKLVNFNSTYGYDFNLDEDANTEEFKRTVNEENRVLLEELTSLIKEYSKYYEGSYYDDEDFDEVYNDFHDFLNMSEKITGNISNHTRLFSFMESASNNGTAKRIYDRNRNFSNYKLATPVYLTVANSKALNGISEGSLKASDYIGNIYTDIINTYYSYMNLEDLGIATGDLTVDRLSRLVIESEKIISRYYNNVGILEALEDENEKE